MSIAVGAHSAPLPNDDAHLIVEALAAALVAKPGPEPELEAGPRHAARTDEMPVVRPVPRPQHVAAPHSPVGRVSAAGPVDPLEGLLTRPLDSWSDRQLAELTEQVLDVRHKRRKRMEALRVSSYVSALQGGEAS